MKGRFIRLEHYESKEKRIVIILEQKFDANERTERGHSNVRAGRDVGLPESAVRNTVKHAGEIKEAKIASDFCGLQTFARTRSRNICKDQKSYTDINRVSSTCTD
jgi:hypothetical protein